MLNDSDYIVTLNQHQYYFKITISNGDKNNTPLEIPYIAVEELQIEETLFNWNVTASLILKNDYELIERGFVSETGASSKSPYTFRHDGRNKVNIRIFPNLSEDRTDEVISTKPELLELNYDFVIYDVEDMPSDDQAKKQKRLRLWDERYQHFLERNIQWSTYYVAAELDKIAKSKAASSLDSTLNAAVSSYPVLADNRCKVGLAVKHLIETACGENAINSANSIPLKVGWSPDDTKSYNNLNSINDPTLTVASFDNTAWDEGSDANKICYTSPATSNVIDDLDYLMQYYVSSIDTKEKTGLGMPGLLRLTRYSKMWQLTGLDQLYSKSTAGDLAGEDTIESIEVQTTHENIYGNKKTPTFKGDGKNFTSKILSYRFVNMSNVDDIYINNRPVVNYDNETCRWIIYYEDSTPEAVKSMLKDTLLPKVFNNKNKSGVLININKDKSNGLNTTPLHTVLQSSTVSVLGRNSMIPGCIFLNQALEFNSLGATARQPGKFINIDRTNGISVENNDFEDKFIGQWLLTKVTHAFKEDRYLNNTIGVKFNSFSELSIFKPENDKFNE